MTPLSAIAMVGIAPKEAGAASGLFNMLRNLGGAIGTAAVETFFTKREQYHSFIINAHVSLLQPATRVAAGQVAAVLHACTACRILPRPCISAVIAVGETIRAQATLMGYADSFALLGVMLLGAVLAVVLLKKGDAAAGGAH